MTGKNKEKTYRQKSSTNLIVRKLNCTETIGVKCIDCGNGTQLKEVFFELETLKKIMEDFK